MKLFGFIYRLISVIILPFIAVFLLIRLLKNKEDKKRIFERFGFSNNRNFNNQPIWIHAVSVGETNSALVLVEDLLKLSPNVTILFTTTTLSSAKILQEKIAKFNSRIIHQFLPIDSYFCVEKFLDYWQPKIGLFVESEIWPNLILSSAKRSIAIFLVNARISKKSSRKWLLAKRLKINIFDYFQIIFAQSQEDKEKIQSLTKNKVLYFGNLKSQSSELLFDQQKLLELQEKTKERRLWLCASTHQGEEELLLKIHDNLKKQFPDLLTIILPRHPNRSKEVIQLLDQRKFSQRSKNQLINDDIEIYLADTLNELGIFYRLVEFAFIGGSLLPIGGHNPYEAIRVNCAIITGKETFNFSEIYNDLLKVDGCAIVKNSDELENMIRKLLNNKDLSRNYNKNAHKIINQSGNISLQIIQTIPSFYFV